MEVFFEINENLKKSYDSDHNLKIIIRGLDVGRIEQSPDYLDPHFEYPKYLTDLNPFNDTEYLLNKTVFQQDVISSLIYTIKGCPSKNLDDFGSWDRSARYGREFVLANYTRDTDHNVYTDGSEPDYSIIKENIERNVIKLAEEHPETTFYLFFPPASIVGMDSYNNIGGVDYLFDTLMYVSEMLLSYDNIRLYCWSNNKELVCNLDNYKDPWHYSGEVNSMMLGWMKSGEGLLTKENYTGFFEECRNFYKTYEYDEIFK